MVNANATKQELVDALERRDPHRLVQVFEIQINGPPAKAANGNFNAHRPFSISVDGKDVGSLLASLVDTKTAAEVVSYSCVDLCFFSISSETLWSVNQTYI